MMSNIEEGAAKPLEEANSDAENPFEGNEWLAAWGTRKLQKPNESKTLGERTRQPSTASPTDLLCGAALDSVGWQREGG